MGDAICGDDGVAGAAVAAAEAIDDISHSHQSITIITTILFVDSATTTTYYA